MPKKKLIGKKGIRPTSFRIFNRILSTNRDAMLCKKFPFLFDSPQAQIQIVEFKAY